MFTKPEDAKAWPNPVSSTSISRASTPPKIEKVFCMPSPRGDAGGRCSDDDRRPLAHPDLEVRGTVGRGASCPLKPKAFIVPPKSARKADGSKLKPADVVRPKAENRVLKVNFVDVQQGDAAIIESPDGKVILVDGGDNQLFARYLAARFPGTSAAEPQPIDCILVTHGDADHFSGSPEIFESEKHEEARKRLFIAPERVYPNGLVKRPTTDENGNSVPDKALLGSTKVVDGTTLLVDLVDDLLDAPDEEMNSTVPWLEEGAVALERAKAPRVQAPRVRRR